VTVLAVGGEHDASLTMDMTPPPNLVPPSLRVSPTRLRKEIEGLNAKIEADEDKLKILKADRGKPEFATSLVHTLRWITQTDDTLTENKNRLSEAKASLEKFEHDDELRNKGMLYLSSISSLMVFI
jgi:septal ring factor EnvC (AmiA/AmiB activator)